MTFGSATVDGATVVPVVDCGITDKLARVVPVGGLWGTSDSSLVWHLLDGLARTDAYSVDGEFGIIDATPANTSGDGDPGLQLVYQVPLPTTITWQFMFSNPNEFGFDEPQFYLANDNSTGFGIVVRGLDIWHDSTVDGFADDYISLNDTPGGSGVPPSGLPHFISPFPLVRDALYNARLFAEGGSLLGKLWLDSDPEPDWMLATGDPTMTDDGYPYLYFFVPNTSTKLKVKNFNIDGVNICTVPH